MMRTLFLHLLLLIDGKNLAMA
ncbi:hypothetical protein A2U01_0117534, partial [Trifolium medium]|nr:hypothetical protein [Trifolium medium]